MKSFFALSISLVVAAVAAAPTDEEGWHLRRADQIDLENVEIVDLKISNEELFPGKVFEGTVESIFQEIQALDPAAVSNSTDIDVSPNPAFLDKRSTFEGFNCGWGSTVNRYDIQCGEGIGYLQRLNDFMCDADPTPNPPHNLRCARVSCSHSCAMYLCNKTTKRYYCRCGSIAKDIGSIAKRCGQTHGTPVTSTIFSANGAMDFNDHYIGLTHNSC